MVKHTKASSISYMYTEDPVEENAVGMIQYEAYDFDGVDDAGSLFDDENEKTIEVEDDVQCLMIMKEIMKDNDEVQDEVEEDFGN